MQARLICNIKLRRIIIIIKDYENNKTYRDIKLNLIDL